MILAGLTIISLKTVFIVLFGGRFLINLFWQKFESGGLGPLDFYGLFMAGLCIFAILQEKRQSQKANLLPFIIFLSISVISSLHLLMMDYPFLETMKLQIKLGTPILMLWAIPKIFSAEKDVKLLLYAWLIGSAIITPIEFYYAVNKININPVPISYGVERFAGPFHDPATPSNIAMVGILVGIFILLKARPKRRIVSFTIICLVTAQSYLMTLAFSRAIVIATVLSIAAWLLLDRKYFYGGGIVFMAIILSQTPYVQTMLNAEFQYIAGEERIESTMSGRSSQWERSVSSFRQRDIGEALIGGPNRENPHNQALYLLMLLGLAGMISYYIMCGYVIIILGKKSFSKNIRKLYSFIPFVLAIFLGTLAMHLSATPIEWMDVSWFLWSFVALALNSPGESSLYPRVIFPQLVRDGNTKG
jgi:hypothetical protein